ncbi:hypothetical protein FOCC_FOCC011221 [Frankliniella occidentalis]|nr:hypothetical protein FOCC_FOCC011221 [Frankliniella occidentalis]
MRPLCFNMRWAVVFLLVTGSEALPPAYSIALTNVLSNLLRRATRDTPVAGMAPKTENIPKELAHLRPTTDLISKLGLPAEGHYVTTEDGYTLRMDRIPRPGSPVAFLGNVLSCSSACFVALGRDSIASRLYDAGYDVWLGNWRGSGLSLKHKYLKPSQREFWNFGFVPRARVNGFACHGRLHLGCDKGAIAHLHRPLDGLHGVPGNGGRAPGVRQAHQRGLPNGSRGRPVAPQQLCSAQDGAQYRELNCCNKALPLQFPGSDFMIRYLGGMFCRFNVPSLAQNEPNKRCPLLRAVGDMMGGAGYVVYPVDLQYYAPSGISMGEVNHYAQLSNPGWTGFRKYNYGRRKNREIYGQDVPPDYDLTKSRTPVYVYTGKTDVWTPPQAINQLHTSFKNFRRAFEMPDKVFGHFDFVLNPTRAPVLYDLILQDMKELRDEQYFIGNRKRSAN